MSDFVIPKGKEYTFHIYVKDDLSVLPKDLTGMGTATLEIVRADDSCSMFTVALAAIDALNGVLLGTISTVQSDTLDVARGPKEDGYYLKALYQGLIDITFIDTTASISVLLQEVYVHPEGLTCP